MTIHRMVGDQMNFYSERLFPIFPSFAVTATLIAKAEGIVTGPAVTGMVFDGRSCKQVLEQAAILMASTQMLFSGR